MLIRGEALIETITLAFTISGKRGEWAVSITAPGGVVTSDETTERTWFPLFTEMLASSYEMLVAGDFRGGRSPVRHGDDNTGAASPHADVGRASRHALLAGFLAGPW